MNEKTIEGLVVVKLLITLQTSLELMDELKETKVYRHKVKQVVNMATNVLEDYFNDMYKLIEIKGDNEDAYLEIQNAVHTMLNTSVIEIVEKYGRPQENE
jgi:hypothetical protein